MAGKLVFAGTSIKAMGKGILLPLHVVLFKVSLDLPELMVGLRVMTLLTFVK